MYFVVYAKDGPGSQRGKYRGDHLKFLYQNLQAYRFGGPLLDEAGKPVGSLIIFELPSRAELDRILASDPYFTNNVFSSVEIHATRQIVPEQTPGSLAAEIEKERALGL
jgi:uncharacterized protein